MDFRLVGITLQEALDMAYDETDVNDVANIYIEPPESQVHTDEDSGDEDSGGLVDNLNRQQLTAGAEVVFSNDKRVGGIDYDADLSADPMVADVQEQRLEELSPSAEIINMEPVPESSKKKLTICNRSFLFEYYHEGDLESPRIPFPTSDYTQYKNMSCVELFELFITDELLTKIAAESKHYAASKNNQDFAVTISELRVFIGILILSGYNVLPSKRSYWENAKDMRNELVVEAMRRDKFLQICRFLHFANNDHISLDDKMYKLRNFMDYLKTKFCEHFVPEQNLSYDESMVRYYGRHGCKQFIRGKPIRFGYKIWCLNTPSGYLINFEVYQGSNPRANVMYEKRFGKAAAPLLQMIEDLDEKGRFRYNFFFDNLFTGMEILTTLKDNGYGSTGTIRENRVPKNCPLIGKSIMAKKARGHYSSALEKVRGIQLVRWMDNSVVTVASTVFGVNPVKTVDRFCRQQKKRIPIPRPELISQYNKNMGGTDQMDNNIGCYRIGIRSKKWYWSIFTHLLDAAIQNAWIIYRKTGRSISQLDFRRNIVQTYLTKYKTAPKGTGRVAKAPGSDNRVNDNIRFDGFHHYIVPVPGGKRRRCANKDCTSRGRSMCEKCDVGLCDKCFKNFHTA